MRAATGTWHRQWPVLKRYTKQQLTCIAMPLGGIGTGTVSLGGRGDLRDWEVVNRAAKGVNGKSFFALWVQRPDGTTVTRALEGALLPPYAGGSGCTAPFHGLPRFRQSEFAVAYPLAQVALADPGVPVAVRLEAFNPLIPANADDSGLPVAVLRYVLRNTTRQRLRASVCGNLQSFIGNDGTDGQAQGNVVEYRAGGSLKGLYFSSTAVAPTAPQYGTLALTTTAADVTYKRNWEQGKWSTGILHFWDDFSADGRLDDQGMTPAANPTGALAASVDLPPGATAAVTFLLTWHFPNRQTWTPVKVEAPAAPAAGASAAPASGTACCAGGACANPNRVGNYYCTRYADAWAAATAIAPRLAELEAATLGFVSAFCAADLPPVVKEAALANLSSLRCETSFRTEDGNFFGWEGCSDRIGCCYGSCTHVWNYEQATAFLFGDLARRMRTVEFLHATRDDGHMSFRVNLPLARAQGHGIAAADGQMGCLLKLYREWQLSGDDAFLRRLWPRAKAALAFCWAKGGWDADQDGVMEGCQHNTLDVEYYGPNPLMQGWYLGALRAGEEMARHVGDAEFAAKCATVFASGRAWTDAHLFNGEYYEQEVRPPASEAAIAPGLRTHMGADQLADPDFQLGAGCMVDQLVGQYVAHVCGLGYLLDVKHVRATLKAIMRHNFKTEFYDHFNNMRTYALNDEAGLLMVTYPRGRRPKSPVPYFNELMTGFEYSAAVHMLYEGQTAAGVKAIAAVRARYDGARRNPFDEAECGHHYARAMAVWGAVLALSGFQYSAVSGTMTFKAQVGQQFWSTGNAWGTCTLAQASGKSRRGGKPRAGGKTGADGTWQADLRVLGGELKLATLALTGAGATSVSTATLAAPATLRAGDRRRLTAKRGA